jgi:hypothetical protein
MFAIVPLCGAIAVWLTFVLGRRFASASAGAIAALLLAASPPFLYQIVQPMSEQNAMYGGPLKSGYGDLSFLFRLEHIWPNLQRYPVWLIQTERHSFCSHWPRHGSRTTRWFDGE